MIYHKSNGGEYLIFYNYAWRIEPVCDMLFTMSDKFYMSIFEKIHFIKLKDKTFSKNKLLNLLHLFLNISSKITKN